MTTGRINQVAIVRRGSAIPPVIQGEELLATGSRPRRGAPPSAVWARGPETARDGIRFPLLDSPGRFRRARARPVGLASVAWAPREETPRASQELAADSEPPNRPGFSCCSCFRASETPDIHRAHRTSLWGRTPSAMARASPRWAGGKPMVVGPRRGTRVLRCQRSHDATGV